MASIAGLATLSGVRVAPALDTLPVSVELAETVPPLKLNPVGELTGAVMDAIPAVCVKPLENVVVPMPSFVVPAVVKVGSKLSEDVEPAVRWNVPPLALTNAGVGTPREATPWFCRLNVPLFVSVTPAASPSVFVGLGGAYVIALLLTRLRLRFIAPFAPSNAAAAFRVSVPRAPIEPLLHVVAPLTPIVPVP